MDYLTLESLKGDKRFLVIAFTEDDLEPGHPLILLHTNTSISEVRIIFPKSRSLSEYLLVLSHGRWISLGFGLFGLGPTLCAHYPPQSTPTLQERRQIFKRLWVKHISCHSADTFSRPRNRNLRIPRADLIMPNTGSTMCLRAA